MIAGWLVYCAVVAALLGAAAACGDAIVTRRGISARWIWSAAIAGTVLIPACALVLQQREPKLLPLAGEASSGNPFRTRVLARAGETAPRAEPVERPRTPELPGSDRLAVILAVASIALAGLRVAADSVLLYRQRRHWRRDTLDGVDVMISDDVGPAIVGLIEPVIVVPRWMTALSVEDRTLMLAHEREHLRVHDGRLTTGALLTVLCAPWNPMLWWSLRRLRTAIEIDCDRRVLRAHPDISRYGRLLVDVAQRAVGSSFAIAGFSERAAPLARRIQAMTRRARPAVGSDALAAVAGGVALAGSIAMLPPTAPARALRDYGGYQQPLPKNVGDSIARGDSTRVFAAASNLPAAFSVVEYGPSNQDFPIAARCAMRLRDDRDGTRLTLSISTAATGSVVQRADTAWTHVRSFGYYMVEPKGRYGVGDDQTLRVGCGSYTRVAVNGREIDRQNVVTLDTPNDDRARGVAAQFLADLHLRADIVELGEGRINIGIADSLASRPEGGDLAFGRAAFAILRARLGAATPETLAVLSQLRKDSWSTVYFYNSMAR